MGIALHYENANFLRELAENLPRIHPKTHKPEQIELLQRLANEELAQAEHVEWVCAKVAAARADKRPLLTSAEVDANMQSFFDGLKGV